MAKTRRRESNKKAEEVPPSDGALAGKSLNVALSDVKANKFNYNKQSAFVFEKMVQSLKEFGFVDPLIVRSGNDEESFGYYEVIGGEHRMKAATEMGYEMVPVIDLGRIADVKAKKLCIVLNETKGRPDSDALASLITELEGEVGIEGLSVLPFDDDEMQAFLDVSGEWDTSNDDDPSLSGDIDPVVSDKKSIMSVMGLLDISKKKEKFLISQFEDGIRLSGHSPIRCFESMLSTFIRSNEGE